MATKESSCPFCVLPPGTAVAGNSVAIAVRDNFPVARGHTLIVPKQHRARLSDVKPEEWAGLWQLVFERKAALEEELNPDGFNIGINDGETAGQTVAHVHIHVIPRFRGDVQDPRGGVRWVVPHKAPYWEDE